MREYEEYEPALDFSDLNVGDRLRLVHRNGDLSEFTVHRCYSAARVYDSYDQAYYTLNMSKIEVARPKREFKPGVYLPFTDTGDRGMLPNVWLLQLDGTWVCLGNAARFTTTELSAEDVRRHEKTLVFLGTGNGDGDPAAMRNGDWT